jgi:2'-5' RNA ligase
MPAELREGWWRLFGCQALAGQSLWHPWQGLVSPNLRNAALSGLPEVLSVTTPRLEGRVPGGRVASWAMRLFVAVWPPPAVVGVLSELERPEAPGLRWSVPEQWMVKLRPLGHVDRRVVAPLLEVLAAELDGAPAVCCVLGPAARRRYSGQWLAVPVAGLDDLASVVFEATERLVPVTHPQPFQAELALARGRVPKQWTACPSPRAGRPARCRWSPTAPRPVPPAMRTSARSHWAAERRRRHARSGLPGGCVVPRLQVTAGAVASRVAEAFHSTTDPTRPPEVCVPQRVRQPRLPSRLPRPAGPAARPPPRRLPPGDDPALPARLAREPDRRAARLRPRHRAPLDPPLHQHGTGGLGDRPRSGRPRLGSPRLGQRIRRLLRQPKAWTIGRLWQQLAAHHQPAEPAPPCARGRLLAAAPPGRTRRPDRDQVLTDLHQHIRDLPSGAVLLAEDEATSTCCGGCGPPGSSGGSASRS